MEDPGFPVGGHAPVKGGVDLRHGHFSVKMYVKTKELGPMGGGGACAGYVSCLVASIPFFKTIK